ncbi:hypothetical protein B0T18DRAFT_393459 [Schizothecium vesticola]|uniref:Uncharacterized protein n=1 Tax=Schizothecium vesticola TaxID=314040 RepID=A0AA40EJU0_9PEZI|nr:hypothetical protein B0T18DRAFT_393459 [Schizothecium vesticola]
MVKQRPMDGPRVSPPSYRCRVGGGGTDQGEPTARRSADGDKPGVATWPGASPDDGREPGVPDLSPQNGKLVHRVEYSLFVHWPVCLATKPSPPPPRTPSRRRPTLDGEENRKPKKIRTMILNVPFWCLIVPAAQLRLPPRLGSWRGKYDAGLVAKEGEKSTSA